MQTGQTQPQQTETGIDITTYISDKQAGHVIILKPDPASKNYIYRKANYSVASTGGVTSIVEKTPTLLNLNRGSLDELIEKITAEEVILSNARSQINAMIADLDALDAV